MDRRISGGANRAAMKIIVGALVGFASAACCASDHLDSPTARANPQADIGDLYAWTSPDGRRLNLVMDIVGKTFSNRIHYAFHVDSGARFGKTTASMVITCDFPAETEIDCRAGDADQATGNAGNPAGLESRHGTFRVFAGLRDDPFFNNVKGTRAAYQVAFDALKHGAATDAAGCPNFDAKTVASIRDQWRHTDGGPAKNFLAGWTTSALVISIDLDAVAKGGRYLAVWSTTSTSERQINRVGRPMTKNALVGLLASDDESNRLKEDYNSISPAEAAYFIPEIERSLAVYDGLDGDCGNQWLADTFAEPSMRYGVLASLLADDRLWVDSASTACTGLFAVELSSLSRRSSPGTDCGGRTPLYSAANTFRSLLVGGATTGTDDGLDHHERRPSAAEFPFLAPADFEQVSKGDYK